MASLQRMDTSAPVGGTGLASTAAALLTATTAVTVAASYYQLVSSRSSVDNKPLPFQSLDKLPANCINHIRQNLADISDDALIKLTRQLDFWMRQGLTEQDMTELTERLVETATWRVHHNTFQVPKVRYGKTELMIPILTCGGMRVQATWLPDDLPISMARNTVLQSPSQENIKTILRQCLAMGMNHFETARMYGTSEVQLAQALYEMIQDGDIQRGDFILQTKTIPSKTRHEFETRFMKSWTLFEKLGYIDLFAFHCVCTNEQVEWALDDGKDGIFAAAKEWQAKGWIKHIGFSTHGTAKNIMDLINSEQFSFVNLHMHYVGSYHAEGTENGFGHHGNRKAVERALELDMGVFNISPIDKGGKLFAPSAVMAQTIGHKLSPISFNLLHIWRSGMHTASIGLARPSDLDEVLEAARLYTHGSFSELDAAEERMNNRLVDVLGQDWVDKGLLKLPDCFEEQSGMTGIGNIIWYHNLISAFGMYDFCKTRYSFLEKVKYDKKKSFAENTRILGSGMLLGNIGIGYDETFDYSKALENHYDPVEAARKMRETHEWLSGSKKLSARELKERGWEQAYDLTTWHEFPDTSRLTVPSLLLQNISGGRLGCGGGPNNAEITSLALALRKFYFYHDCTRVEI